MNDKIDGDAVEQRYKMDTNMHRRNWLMVWQMEDNGMSMDDLARATGIHVQHLNKFMLTKEKETISNHCERICRALKCQPRDLGWGLKFTKFNTPGRIDVSVIEKLLIVQIAGLKESQRILNYSLDHIREVMNIYVDDNF